MDAVRRLERGQTSEAVLIFPLVLGLVFVIIQVGIWAYARNLAVHSAGEGATAAAAHQSTRPADAATRASLEESADGVLREYSVSSSRSGDAVTVTVRGSALSLVPLVELPPIEQSISVPVEQYVP